MNSRIFACCLGEGISYSDRQREKYGDYMALAFLPFSTLELEVYKECPAFLRPEIEEDAASIQKRKGEEYQVSTSGQTVTLGWGLK